MAISMQDVRKDIESNFPADHGRLLRAEQNFVYYRRQNHEIRHLRKDEKDEDYRQRHLRRLGFVANCIERLSNPVYGTGASRTVLEGSARVSALLSLIWKTCHPDYVMAEADALATLSGVCAIEVFPTGKPKRPISLFTYHADEFVVWQDPRDPGSPPAVCLISCLRDGMKQFDLWTDETHEIYQSQRPDVRNGAKAPPGREIANRLISSEPNPYGVIPVAYYHNQPPITSFWGDEGIGTDLRIANQSADRAISDQADAVEKYTDPLIYAIGISGATELVRKRGAIIPIPAEPNTNPRIEIEQADLNIEGSQKDLLGFLQLKCEEKGIPWSAIHQDFTDRPMSGIATLHAMAPILDRARRRRRMAEVYEKNLWELAIFVMEAHYPGSKRDEEDGSFVLRFDWPRFLSPTPTPELLGWHEFRLDRGLASMADLLMEFDGIDTVDLANERLREIAKQRKFEMSLFKDILENAQAKEKGDLTDGQNKGPKRE